MLPPGGPAIDPLRLEILPGAIDGPLRFPAIFGRVAPVEMEIGVGKGRFLLDAATRHPETDFLGLEWSVKHLRIARDRAAARGLRNLRLHRGDARHVLASLVADGALERVHVFCPDPWPKKRHHKRRLFVPETTRHLERVLRPGGYLNVSTDYAEYFEAIVEVVGAVTGLARAEDPRLPADGETAGRTNYEVKYLAAGRAIHRATWRRPAE
ncbi:MAG TPA: tRNA (guanosine(46)-N7)-methyltransferase TrmB [Candidatus Polarisedimenticolia bacterium]|nr:tRNA (guanosine(46)-N7)-methyltransferase TrmB [Candidatus Polarisedimenticolia bacterium]